MALFDVIVLFFVLFASNVLAQDTDDNVRVWAAVAYIHNGDRSPFLSSRPGALVPEGAQQLWNQGQAFRARYLNQTDGIGNGTVNAVGSSPITGISTNAIDNTQITTIAAENEAVVGGALAFLQGLYPPAAHEYNAAAGGYDLARNLVQSGNDLIEFPLGGYQYPKLQVLSSSDSESPSIQGTVGCTRWVTETNSTLRKRDDMKSLESESANFYKDLFSSAPLKGVMDANSANIWNAYEIYNQVNYLYTHDKTVHSGLKDTNDTLSKLQQYAFDLERAQNTAPENEKDKDKIKLYPVAGRTLASKISSQLSSIINTNAEQKLTLMFGSVEPMLAFFSISGLLNRENLQSGDLSALPKPGSAMVFELISDATGSDSGLSADNLRIRFFYRSGAENGTAFQDYPLFNSGYGGKSIPYTAFSRQMGDEGLDSAGWCEVCGSDTATWCGGSLSGDNGIFTGHKGLHPVVVGVIGALIMAVIVGVLAGFLYFVAGLRLRFAEPGERKSFGGFKGAEKRPEDTDVDVTRGGAHQERVGSWELRDGAPSMSGLGGVINKSFPKAVTRDIDDRDDDQMSILGAKPTMAREAV